MKPSTPDAYRLLHEGSLTLSVLEQNGMKIDTDYLNRAIKKATKQVKRGERRLEKTDVWKQWTRKFGGKAKLGNKAQMATVLFEVMGYERAPSQKGINDKTAFRYVDHPFVEEYFKTAELRKARDTNLKGILREVADDGKAHVFYDLNNSRTYRSSSSRYNSQNIPVRNALTAELVRRAFIPYNDDHVLVEIDFSGIEVRGAACYNKDPVLISYLCDKTKDMHRDMAMECYMLKKDQVSKDTRYCAKNKFVFPEFYGSFFPQCSLDLWEAIDSMHLKYADESRTIREHLKRKGITRLGDCSLNQKDHPAKKGTFEYHLKEVEAAFWGERFKVYSRWKQQWYERYLKRGYFKTKTGFVMSGHYKRNEAINYPIQGSSFHILLQSLIFLVDEIKKRKMKTRVCGQIHDSVLASVPRKELQDYLSLAHEIMTEWIPTLWRWIIVPLEVEISVCEESWFEKVEWIRKEEGGLWIPKT